MKNNQILQHIVNGVEIEILNYKNDYVGIKYSKANGFYRIGESVHVTYDGGSTGKSISEFKPILRPLSDLTKEIEVNGEKFVPIKKIGLLFDIELDEFESDENIKTYGWTTHYQDDSQPYEFGYFRDGLFGYWYDDKDESYPMQTFCNLNVIEKLLEWHFDIYGLIEKGLAIDINTLK